MSKHEKHEKNENQSELNADTCDSQSKDAKLTNKVYTEALRKMHIELVKLQKWVHDQGLKVIIVFEGRDGAGKGGVIKAITERVSPRIFRVVALPAPNEREKSEIYLQRYIKHFPAGGEIVIFDRSWYNRAGVERVMGFCTPKQVDEFLESTPLFEKFIINSGVILIKYWLEVDMAEQSLRLRDRLTDGRKTWKLSPMDLASYTKWDEYTEARDDMFAHTDTPWAPWHVAYSNDKKRARLNVIHHILQQIPYEDVHEKTVKFPKRKPGKPSVRETFFKFIPNYF